MSPCTCMVNPFYSLTIGYFVYCSNFKNWRRKMNVWSQKIELWRELCLSSQPLPLRPKHSNSNNRVKKVKVSDLGIDRPRSACIQYRSLNLVWYQLTCIINVYHSALYDMHRGRCHHHNLQYAFFFASLWPPKVTRSSLLHWKLCSF